MLVRFVRRRALLLGAICLSLVAGLALLTSPTARPAGPAVTGRPNIIFVYADDLDRKMLPYLPNVQRHLVRQGTTFRNFLYNSALCCPSRATMLRGQYAHNTRVFGNTAENGGFYRLYRRGLERSTLATWLRRSGYATGYFGKYFNGYAEQAGLPLTYTPPGWTEWFGNGGGAYDGYGYRFNHNGRVVSYGNEPSDYVNGVIANAAVSWVRERVSQAAPFYATISPMAPHAPFVAAPRHDDLFADVTYPKNPNFNEPDVSDKQVQPPRLTRRQIAGIDDNFRKRLRAAQSVDDLVGRLVRLLATHGELGNTIIAFTSDNGFHMGEHRLGPTVGGKFTAFEEDLRVPLIIRGPGIRGGLTRTALVGNVDVPVSFARAAGVTPPAFVDGRSFMPLLRGQPVPRWRSSFLLQRGPDTTRPFHGLRTYRYTYVEYDNGFRELYDLRRDPWQLSNIAGSADRTLVARLHTRLQRLKGCVAAGCRSAEQGPLG